MHSVILQSCEYSSKYSPGGQAKQLEDSAVISSRNPGKHSKHHSALLIGQSDPMPEIPLEQLHSFSLQNFKFDVEVPLFSILSINPESSFSTKFCMLKPKSHDAQLLPPSTAQKLPVVEMPLLHLHWLGMHVKGTWLRGVL